MQPLKLTIPPPPDITHFKKNEDFSGTQSPLDEVSFNFERSRTSSAANENFLPSYFNQPEQSHQTSSNPDMSSPTGSVHTITEKHPGHPSALDESHSTATVPQVQISSGPPEDRDGFDFNPSRDDTPAHVSRHHSVSSSIFSVSTESDEPLLNRLEFDESFQAILNDPKNAYMLYGPNVQANNHLMPRNFGPRLSGNRPKQENKFQVVGGLKKTRNITAPAAIPQGAPQGITQQRGGPYQSPSGYRGSSSSSSSSSYYGPHSATSRPTSAVGNNNDNNNVPASQFHYRNQQQIRPPTLKRLSKSSDASILQQNHQEMAPPLRPSPSSSTMFQLDNVKSVVSNKPIISTESAHVNHTSCYIDMASLANALDDAVEEEPNPTIQRSNTDPEQMSTRSSIYDGNAPTPMTGVVGYDRVARAIELQEQENYREATYELQMASLAGDKVAMLLYGLALRNGWGIRKNEAQAIKWFEKAADIDIDKLEEEENDTKKSKKNKENKEKKGKFNSIDPLYLEKKNLIPNKSPNPQLSTALYEIGMSFCNPRTNAESKEEKVKNERMAIKCLEMAASMGDGDAMQQAGVIWMTKSYKRKKNMMRSAAWFRLSDKKGISMVGNSWVYKDKYANK